MSGVVFQVKIHSVSAGGSKMQVAGHRVHVASRRLQTVWGCLVRLSW